MNPPRWYASFFLQLAGSAPPPVDALHRPCCPRIPITMAGSSADYLLTVALISLFCQIFASPAPPPSKTVYTGVFLNRASHVRLLHFWNNTVPFPPNLGHLYAAHMTLQFAPTQEEVDALPKGMVVSVYPFIWASDGRTCEGVQVFSPSIKSNNTFSHVTVSTGLRTGAVCTNDLIADVYNKSVNVSSGAFSERFQLDGCVDTFPPSGKCNDFLKS